MFPPLCEDKGAVGSLKELLLLLHSRLRLPEQQHHAAPGLLLQPFISATLPLRSRRAAVGSQERRAAAGESSTGWEVLDGSGPTDRLTGHFVELLNVQRRATVYYLCLQ